ncbi:MAG: hypothetical protein ACOCSN_06260 [Halanaeroarchaeum sp.]
MPMDTYTLVVRETSNHDGIDADVLDEDGLVETSTQLRYNEYGVAAEREDDAPDRIEREFTVNAGSLDIQFERDDQTFAFCAVVDDEEAARIEVSDTDWDLRNN